MGLVALATAAAIEAVVLKPGYGSGFGGSITVAYRPVVLFADGRYTTDAAGALADSPRIDGRWQREGGRVVLQAADGKRTVLDPKLAARPAGSTLEGTYRASSGVGAPGTGVAVVAAAQSFTFTRDGRVQAERAAGATSGTTATASHSAQTGRYRLDGWTLTITGDDGRAETRLFYRYPDGDDAIGWGAATLSRRKGAP